MYTCKRAYCILTMAFATLLTCAQCYAATPTFIQSNIIDNATVDWYLYRNTLVALSDNGMPMCITPPGSGYTPTCYQVTTTDPTALAQTINRQRAAGGTLTCNSNTYVQYWGTVPHDPDHWCNDFSKEALTVRATKRAMSWNLSSPRSYNDPYIAFLVPAQATASGPQTVMYPVDLKSNYSLISVSARNLATSQTHAVVLRASRILGPCISPNAIPMNVGNLSASCQGVANSQLALQFNPNDNSALPAGEFVGAFTVNPSLQSGASVVPPALLPMVINIDIVKN